MKRPFQRTGVLVASLAVVVLGAGACGRGGDQGAAQAEAADTGAGGGDSGAGASGADQAVPASEAPSANRLDLSALPVSSVALGAFPYLGLPDGYEVIAESQREFGRFPLWDGEAFQTVEGRLFLSLVETRDAQAFSALELQRNLEHLISRAGGRKVSEAEVPSEALSALNARLVEDVADGWGDVYNAPIALYAVRRADSTIWVHYVGAGSGAAISVIETAPFVATASLLPADELARRIEADGRVAVSINFAVDSAEVLSDSRGQIDQIAALLRDRPDWRLSVEGHTDNTGGADHNRRLSESRARSVVGLLTAGGVAAERLQARGFGADRPVTANDTDEGRARNRRVELVRL